MAIYMWREETPTFEYSYDFKNKDIATLTTDGRTFPSWSTGIAFNSDWMYKSSHWLLPVVREIDLSSASKITLTGTCIMVSDRNVAYLLYQNENSWDSAGIWTNYQNIYWTFPSASRTQSANPTWTFTTSTVIDLVNKTANMELGAYSQSFTLTDAQVTTVRALKYLQIQIAKTGNYICDVSLTIEY